MKIYPSDIPQPVNSQARQPENIVIPPFYFKGALTASVSGKWYPPRDFILTGGYITTTSDGTTFGHLYILKNNIFEVDIIAGDVEFTTTDRKALFSLSNPLTGALSISRYDWITIYSSVDSGHVNTTVQLYGHAVN